MMPIVDFKYCADDQERYPNIAIINTNAIGVLEATCSPCPGLPGWMGAIVFTGGYVWVVWASAQQWADLAVAMRNG